jgi:hypothetical protein
MRIGDARQADILREVVPFSQRLVNFLFADRVLCELIAANDQARQDQYGGKNNLLHGVPQHPILASNPDTKQHAAPAQAVLQEKAEIPE